MKDLRSVIAHRSVPLVVAIVLLLVAYPGIPDTWVGDVCLGGLVFLLVTTGVVSLAGRGRLTVVALVLGTAAIATHVLLGVGDGSEEQASELYSAVVFVPFCLLIAGNAMSYAIHRASVTNDRLIAVAATYLMTGLAWSGVHSLIHLADDEAYFFPTEEAVDWGSFVYFSFVTLTTLGYGDVAPRSEPAQAAVTLEAIFGVFFLGFLVARMMAAPTELSSDGG